MPPKTSLATCQHCGKQFPKWRQKRFCSEPCRKADQNRRLGYVRRDAGVLHRRGVKSTKCPEGKRALFRRYETLSWTACNEVTKKLTREGSTSAIGWLMNVDGKGWYGRVRDARGDWTFGPASATRAIAAVEARIRHEPFDPRFDDGERAWLGDAMRALHPPRVPAPKPTSQKPVIRAYLRPGLGCPAIIDCQDQEFRAAGIEPCCELVRQAFPGHQIELWRQGRAGWPGYPLYR
jgi:hypothetical protein